MTETKFKEGEIVCAKEAPTHKLVIRRFLEQIYYCRLQEYPDKKELVYFERELMPLPGTNNPA